MSEPSRHERTLDVSDVERYVGIPLGGFQQKHPFSANDIRRWALAMRNPNPLHLDEAYAALHGFASLPAPQSFLGGGVTVGPAAARQGVVPGAHELIAGDEVWWYGPRLAPGDVLRADRMLHDMEVKTTRFAGPSLFTRGDTLYANQRGEFVARVRTTIMRYLPEKVATPGTAAAARPASQRSSEQLAEIDRDKLTYVRHVLESSRRTADEVTLGDPLPRCVHGPHSLVTFTSERLSDQGQGSAYHDHTWPDTTITPAPTAWSRDDDLARNPLVDHLLHGDRNAHTDPSSYGMPREFGYGPSMAAWATDYLANWAGDLGFVRHARSEYRQIVYGGDLTIITGQVCRLERNPRTGNPTAEVAYEMHNQDETVVARGRAEVELGER